jgi:hypothetical protein
MYVRVLFEQRNRLLFFAILRISVQKHFAILRIFVQKHFAILRIFA